MTPDSPKLEEKCRDCGKPIPPAKKPFDICPPCGIARMLGKPKKGKKP